MTASIKFTNAATDEGHVRYCFTLSAHAYYGSDLSDFDAQPDENFFIEVHTELESDFDNIADIVCENCDEPTLPYFWVDGHDMNSCVSHLPEESQTFILDYINTNYAS